ncbi:MAG: PEP-CTERM sorting domain-containing protein [Xenococcaceae cyanobacterium MO_167.B52]|nr:PEP-CTERM sorting domain-containing protein [Xenococcaceae cyanobacterium MO_167.B52]
MNPTNLLQKLAPVGVAAFGALSVIGIAVAPAQASTLGWSNGTSDFFSDVNPDDDDDIFTVIFSPDVTADPPNDGIGAASVDNADGVFAPPFAQAPPIFLQDLVPAVGNFTRIANLPGDGSEEFRYELVDPLVFTFDGVGSETGAGDVTATIADGTDFIGFFDTDNSVEFALAAGQGQAITVAGIDFVNDEGILETFLDDGFEFEDGVLPAGGEYLAEVEYTGVPVPEPTTILGLLTISGLGLGLKRKKQA